MPLSVYGGVVAGFDAWRDITAGNLWVRDASAWRLLKDLHVYDGTAWRLVYSAVTPIGLTATNTGASPFFEVSLSWSNPPGKGSTTMNLERSSGGAYSPVGTLGAGATSHTDNPTSSGSYRYRLKYTDETEWAESNLVNVT